MAAYLVLLVLVQSYTWLICRSMRLANGTAIGLAMEKVLGPVPAPR